MSSVQTDTVARQPDISYTPVFVKYQTRRSIRLAREELASESLPPGFPEQLESSLVWEGRDLAEKYDWTYKLSTAEAEEIEKALKHYKCRHTARL